MILSAPAHAQQFSTFRDVLSGKNHPLGFALKDLTSEWRKIVIQAHVNVSDNVSVNVSGTAHGNSQHNLVGALGSSRSYLTKGDTISVEQRTYLVAYRLPGSALDLGTVLQAVATKTPPTSAKLTPESTLALSLLEVATLGNIEEIRPFNLQAEISESEKAARILAEMFKSEGSSGSTNAPPPKKEETK